MKKLIILAICALSMGSSAIAQTTNTVVVTNVSAERFKSIAASEKDAVIIDLRTNDEIKKGIIKGAIQMDYLAKDFDTQMAKLDKNKTYLVYCQGGGRSGDAAEYMEKQGFKRVFNLEKGFSDWVTKGFPVEKK
ncbi:MAG: rhodanese-like domain-containing protein [Bacteroidota bacterium]|nr:rhodanese-like domain-containing protein [Bacteroidota bacterium]